MSNALTLSPAGAAALKASEGLRLVVYADVVGLPTAGYGHMDKTLKIGTRITQAQADAWFTKDTALAVRTVNACTAFPLAQHQFDALVSFVYNIGVGAFKKSTMARFLVAGDWAAAANEFPRWNKPAAIIGRRQREARLFVTGQY